MSDLRNWLVCVVVTLAAGAAAYEWLDRAIAFYAHDHLARYGIFVLMTQLPVWLMPFTGIILFILGLRALMHWTLSKPHTALLLCSVSLVVATAVKNQLKYVFGRTWPETWIQNNPSLIRDQVFGFFPFHGGRGYASFPSGHTTAICAVISVLWFLYPQGRWLYAACGLVVAAGLVGADHHFLSDVIAGGLLGFSTGWMAVAIWQSAAKN